MLVYHRVFNVLHISRIFQVSILFYFGMPYSEVRRRCRNQGAGSCWEALGLCKWPQYKMNIPGILTGVNPLHIGMVNKSRGPFKIAYYYWDIPVKFFIV